MYALSPAIHARVPTITWIGIVYIHNIMVVMVVPVHHSVFIQ